MIPFKMVAVALTFFTLTACISNTMETPAGSVRSGTVLGVVGWSHTNTRGAFDECRALLKPGHPGEQPLIERDVFAPCFTVAMMGPMPRGQQAPPIPTDLNGDGRPDVARYQNGLQVPYGLYTMFPGMYWPQVYGYYGYGGGGGYGGLSMLPFPPQAPPGRLVTGVGSTTVPPYAYDAPGLQAGNGYVTRGELGALVRPLYEQDAEFGKDLRALDKRTRGSR